jgi:BolA family transcriptional regulator, general stress-responsive regulator
MAVKDKITSKLTETFHPVSLEVIDESHRHKGHAGAREGGESHFRVKITADIFRGKSRVETHRMVNEVLAGEFAEGMHALAIEAKVPIET